MAEIANDVSDTQDRHGWDRHEVARTRFGDFAFENGYPTVDAAGALL